MDSKTANATELMTQFAERTGAIGDRPQKRYLWTDAFAVCNFLALGREDMARRIVDRVHHTLGRHRDDDERIGWLDGASEDHPTRGGLRIGKPLRERGPLDPFSEQLEWERDGQYFHYLTKWMHALDVMARTTHDDRYARWARDLAIAAHRGFVHDMRGTKRMYWKASIDLARPLVATMGHHDPLDGFITSVQLGNLPPELYTDYAAMLDPARLATADALGLGGLLVDACRVHQMLEQATWLRDVDLLDPLLDGALLGLRQYVHTADLDGSPHRRLGFRELGLAIGLAGVERMQQAGSQLPRATSIKLAQVAKFVPLRKTIASFWLAPEHRSTRTWIEHADINDVMLATSLVPSGFLVLPARTPRASAIAR